MIELKNYEVWFVTGSQSLYGQAALDKVAEHSMAIVQGFNQAGRIPVKVVFKPVLTNPDAILRLCLDANAAPACVGLITWMHTFSPAKMWIAGLGSLKKPLLHLHTQFNRSIPWSTIDMDFMNLNQSAHGDREYGFIGARMRLERKVVVGYWEDAGVQSQLAGWMRAACAWQDWQGARVARFGDNMREVAVTEGDKVEAQLRLGYSVGGFGIGDLVDRVDKVTAAEIDRLVAEYEDSYSLAPELRKGGAQRHMLADAARIELGIGGFLREGNFKAFTTTFEDLHGLKQLPGLAVQRLMAEGYGFGAEGDWKTAALVRAMKVMGSGLGGGVSFMEDYTYHFGPGEMKVLGAHMLEVCASLADDKASLEIHPLSIGGKADPARLVFNVKPGPALNASMIDLGNRFRLILNLVDVILPDEPLAMLPVARAVWVPRPNLPVAAAAWIYAGGAHHTGFSQSLSAENMEDFANMAGIETVTIDEHTDLAEFKKELKWNEVYYFMARGF